MVPIFASVAVAVIANGGTDRSPVFPPLHVTVVAAPAISREFIRETLAEAAAIWQPVGVTILWDRAASDDSASELTVTVDDGLTRSADGTATLGWITFAGSETPEPDIHLSRGNAMELMTRTASLHEKSTVWQEYLLSRALGRALAHELGHYLLKSRAHAPQGLMRATRPSKEFFSPDRFGFEITTEQRAWLSDHLPCAHT